LANAGTATLQIAANFHYDHSQNQRMNHDGAEGGRHADE